MATNRIRKSLLALGIQFWLATTALGQAEDDYAPGRLGFGDFDIGAPADLSLYGNYPKPNYGWFGKAEGIYWTIGSPDTTTIGRENFNPAASDGQRLLFQTNSADTGWIESDWQWGNRLEVGYMGDNDVGWMASGFKTTTQTSKLDLIGDDFPKRDNFPQTAIEPNDWFDQIDRAYGQIGVAFLPMLGPDGLSALEGFVNLVDEDGANGTAIFDDDIDQDGVFGRDGIDTGTPNDNPPPGFIPPPDGIPDTAAPVDFDDLVFYPIFFERLHATNETRVEGVELMRVWRRTPFRRWGVMEIFGGPRYFRMRDKFVVIGLGGVLNPNLNVVPGDIATDPWSWDASDGSFWDTEVDNNIIGGQLGGRWAFKKHRVSYISEARAFAGCNFQNFDIFGALGNGLLPGNPNQPLDLGDTSFNDSDSTTELSLGGELRFSMNYQVTNAIQLQAGWTGMYFDGLARASNSIDYRIPDMRITTQRNDQDVFVQGVSFGVEFNR